MLLVMKALQGCTVTLANELLDMTELVQLSTTLDRMMVESRIRDLTYYALGDKDYRIAQISAVISKLPAGWYLIGTGPHFSDIIRVGKEEITIGRASSLIENRLETVIDYVVNDAALTGPREVSRLHLTVRVNRDTELLEARDENSSTGTWLLPDNKRLETESWSELESGQSFSLGPSHVNLLMAVQVDQTP
jgi:hypothetical protein